MDSSKIGDDATRFARRGAMPSRRPERRPNDFRPYAGFWMKTHI
jgi:hypothetical protein